MNIYTWRRTEKELTGQNYRVYIEDAQANLNFWMCCIHRIRLGRRCGFRRWGGIHPHKKWCLFWGRWPTHQYCTQSSLMIGIFQNSNFYRVLFPSHRMVVYHYNGQLMLQNIAISQKLRIYHVLPIIKIMNLRYVDILTVMKVQMIWCCYHYLASTVWQH